MTIMITNTSSDIAHMTSLLDIFFVSKAIKANNSQTYFHICISVLQPVRVH